MDIQTLTIPSKKLQAVLNIFEADLKERILKDKSLPEWYVMTAALVTAHDAFAQVGKIDSMFDTTNSFDLAMLVWCAQARLREQRKAAVNSAPDASLN